MNREPVLKWGAVVGLVNAIVLLLVSLGVIILDAEQIGAIETFVIAVGAFLVPLILAYFPRAKVTPLFDPRDNRGTPLGPIT